MPVPQHVFDPPFNIIRCSHAILDVVDLDASRAFYANAIGLHVEDGDERAVYLRGAEEHQHHSLVLRKSPIAACRRLGFKVGNEGDLDKAAIFFSENGIACAYAEAARLSIADLPHSEAKRALLWVPGFVTSRDR